MSQLRKIAPLFLFGVFFIVMAHTLIPHHHHASTFDHQSCELENEHGSSSFLGGLLELFELDQDSERLQNISPSSKSIVSFSFFYCTSFLPEDFETRVSSLPLSVVFDLSAIDFFTEEIFLSSFSHRGPPQA